MGFLLHFEFGLNRGQIILGLCTLLEALVTVPLCLSFEPIELCPCVLEFALLGFEATICFGNRLQGIRACCSGPILECFEFARHDLELRRAHALQREELTFHQTERGECRLPSLVRFKKPFNAIRLPHHLYVGVVISDPHIHLITLRTNLQLPLVLIDARDNDLTKIPERCGAHEHAGHDPVDV